MSAVSLAAPAYSTLAVQSTADSLSAVHGWSLDKDSDFGSGLRARFGDFIGSDSDAIIFAPEAAAPFATASLATFDTPED
jgi:hypothetical protein